MDYLMCGVWTISYQIIEKQTLKFGPYFTPYTTVNFKRIKDLIVNQKTVNMFKLCQKTFA